MEITIFNGKTHYKWPFSIAMLNYQRVYIYVIIKNLVEMPRDSDCRLRVRVDWAEAAVFTLDARCQRMSKAVVKSY